MKQKTLFISLNHGFAVRNILQTDIFKSLKKSGHRIVIITPNAHEKSFQEQYGGENIFFETMAFDKYQTYFKKNRLQGFLKSVRWFTLDKKANLKTLDDFYQFVHKPKRPSKSLFSKVRNVTEDFLIWILRKSRFLRKALIGFENFLFRPNFHDSIFEKYKPDWLLVTSLGFFDFDQFMMREARKHHVKVLSLILSWDNTSSRGIGSDFPDHLITWTEEMKRELVEMHNMDARKIYIGGVAHFDHYYKKESLHSKEDFLKKFGLQSDKKIIFLATKSPTGFPWNPDIVEIIASAIQGGKIRLPAQLLVRLHPIHFRRRNGSLRFKHFFDSYDAIVKKYGNVVINQPTIQSQELAFNMPDSELKDVASIFHYSDVMVNMFSTMNLEASIFDLPMVNVGFEGWSYQDTKTGRDNIHIDEMQVHNQRVIQTGGSPVVYNQEDLIATINRYLEDPGILKAERRKILEQECGPHRGHAGKAIGKHIAELMNA